jgi:hypothetical protein
VAEQHGRGSICCAPQVRPLASRADRALPLPPSEAGRARRERSPPNRARTLAPRAAAARHPTRPGRARRLRPMTRSRPPSDEGAAARALAVAAAARLVASCSIACRKATFLMSALLASSRPVNGLVECVSSHLLTCARS